MNCTKPHVVVTGASTGIGRATARELAGSGWHVFAGIRRDGDAPSETTPLILDVTRPEQVKAAVVAVEQHVGAAGLAGLVDNAGIGVAWPVELVPLDALRHIFEVNVVGQVAVTQGFLPLLRQARGRIVVIGSIGDRMNLPFGGPLGASKAALAGLTESLRQEVAAFGVRVVLIAPASIHTEAVDKVEQGARRAVDEFPPELRDLYATSYTGMVATAMARERAGSPPVVVARVVSKALTARRPRARYLVGKDVRLLAMIAGWLPIRLQDAIRRRVFGLPAPGSLVQRVPS
ncbi:short-chain dehydrogenase/reductase [Asanoa ishikariensis]|uniref:NADP-dependent 3-hydroxy acid dehydrogenase YdfG n=1 Tax=Asanoa ishikariensis TaxID=137265 RepID=A0A1H3RCH0_9ACTN|nr:SDR family NAD(P)-dependent oxidoreductase [Asanoa ishikariensis]GIF64175.1 short-chain dehydrogenase/reductase [Asanoa ishikariensis]SDZ23320.1 NADP-dependent 3-hydroxy acid dehydrogenase YdfG [Asanoa ishikariensis]